MNNKFQFGNVVVVEKNLVGVIVKSWQNSDNSYNHDIYVRSLNGIRNYEEEEIRHLIYDKELSDEQLEYYEN